MVRHQRILFRFFCALLAFCLFAPVRVTAQSQTNYTEAQLPVFELHSGFWINLHHTLYYEARQRKAGASREATANKSSSATTKSLIAGKGLTDAEQKTWDEAVAYYAANYAEKDLLFTTELIQLKDQLGDFEDCDELSGRKRKFCDAGLPPSLTQVLEATAPVYRARLWPEHDQANRHWILQVAPPVREKGLRRNIRRSLSLPRRSGGRRWPSGGRKRRQPKRPEWSRPPLLSFRPETIAFLPR